MLRNYLKTAWRNLVRNKAFSVINISGLALGLTCSLLIMLWVQDERSVDGFHSNGKQLFQVYERNHYDGKVDAGYATQGLLAEELKNAIGYFNIGTMASSKIIRAGNGIATSGKSKVAESKSVSRNAGNGFDLKLSDVVNDNEFTEF